MRCYYGAQFPSDAAAAAVHLLAAMVLPRQLAIAHFAHLIVGGATASGGAPSRAGRRAVVVVQGHC